MGRIKQSYLSFSPGLSQSLSFSLVFIPLLVNAQQKQNQPLLDSLLQVVSTARMDTNKVKTLGLIAFTYSSINPDEGLKYAELARQLSGRLAWKQGLASAHAELAVNYEAKSDHTRALEHNLEALALFRELKDVNGVAATMANLSLVYMAQSRYDKAMQYAFKALGVEGGSIDRSTTAIVTENIGTIYLEQKNYPKTIRYYSLALAAYQDLNDKNGIARNLGNMGIVYDATGSHSKALNYHQQALQINKELNNQSSVQINLANIGYVYCHLKDYAKALTYQKEALNSSNSLKLANSVAINTGNIGETYLAMATDSTRSEKHNRLLYNREANLNTAIRYLEDAINLCRKINYSGPAVEYSQYLSEAYFLSGKHRRAYLTLKQHTQLKEAVFSRQNLLDLSRLEAQREIDLKNKSIIIKNKEIEINKLVMVNRRNERIIYISVIGIISIVTVIAIREYRRRTRIQKEKLANIAQIQSHELRGPLATILGLAQLFNHESPEDPVNKKVIYSIIITGKKLDGIIRNIVTKTSTE